MSETQSQWVVEESVGYSEYGSTQRSEIRSNANSSSDPDNQFQDLKGTKMKEPLLTDAPATDSHGSSSSQARPSSLRSMLPSSCAEPQSHSTYSATSFNRQDSWIRHPKVKENWKTVLASAVLSILGITLLAIGIVVAFTPARGYHCLIFGVIGLLCLIPGGYHFIYIYCAAVGKPGYEFENLPVLR